MPTSDSFVIPVLSQPIDGSSEFTWLVGRAKTLDREAFATLYRQTVQPVYRYLSARVNNEAEAEDLTQEVFMAALASIEGLRAEDEEGLLAWLFQIARHKLADHLRRRYRHPADPLDESAPLAADGLTPEGAAEAQATQVEVRAALQHLTDEQREVLVCKFVLEYDNQRTASIMGRNPNAVNQLQHRALASLRRLLTREES